MCDKNYILENGKIKRSKIEEIVNVAMFKQDNNKN